MAEQLVLATIADLRTHAPFDRMEPEALRFLASGLTVSYFASGTEVVGPDDGEADRLFIIKKGAVVGEPHGARGGVAVALGPGECFPMAALVGKRASQYAYRTVEDTFFYELRADDFYKLGKSSTHFRDYCTAYLASLVDQSQRDIRALASDGLAETRSLLQPLASLVSRRPVSCGAQTPLREVLQTMSEQGVGSMVIVDPKYVPIGILTQTDVLQRVALAGLDLAVRVDSVMTSEPFTLPAEAPAIEAALAMVRQRLRHVVLVSDGGLAGVVSERDLFALQRVSLRQMAERIRGGKNVPEMRDVAGNMRNLVRGLVAQGAGAGQITQLVSTLNDGLTQRLIEFSFKGRATDANWCWLALGSEGRSEQTLSTDQDNALIFAGDEDPALLRARYLELADEVNRALDSCGFPLCKGEIMARNPKWCLTLDEWRASFSNWIRNSQPEALLNAAIFFDFRVIAGDASLAGNLRRWVLEEAARTPVFLRAMAENALQVRPPLGFFKDFVTDDSPQFPGTIDLKTYGIRPFVDAARVLSLAHRVPLTNTAARLHAAGESGALPAREADAAVEAFQYIQMLRIRHQYLHERPRAGSENRIDPRSVNALDRRILKASFRQGVTLQERLGMDYRL